MTEKSLTAGEIKLKNEIEMLGYVVDMSAQFGKYVVDLYIGELHVGVEYDGEGWHSFKKRDKKRDTHLSEEYYLPILRVADKNYKAQGGIVWYLTSFFDFWSTSAEERKKKHEDKLFDRMMEE